MLSARRSLRALLSCPILATLLPGAGVGHAQVYRCPAPPGQIVFQDRPCEDGWTIEVRPQPPLGGSMLGPLPLAEADHRAALAMAVHSGEPALGMSAEQLDQILGTPVRVHVSNHGRGREERRSYQRLNRTYHVHLRQDRVIGIRNQDSSPPSRKRDCPSPQDIRNAETSASSLTLPSVERQQLRKQVQRMRECRS